MEKILPMPKHPPRSRDPKKSSFNKAGADKTSGKKRGSGAPETKKSPRRDTRAELVVENAFQEEPVKPEDMKQLIAETRRKLDDWLGAAARIALLRDSNNINRSSDLDPWQQQAVDALFAGNNVVVDAPTTAGKTRVVEAFFAMHIDDPGFRACYTCPVKSLSNDKVKEFRAQFGIDKVGIATGDIKENLDAPIVVATLETYRNSLLGVEPDLGRKLVVFDEYHYLMDQSRGSAWEEAIILTPQHCQLLLLSASIANAKEIVAWMESLFERPSTLVQVTHRPVPLADIVYYGSHWVVPDSIPENVIRQAQKRPGRPVPQGPLAKRLVDLLPLGLTPAIVYAGKRLSCELLAMAIVAELSPLPEADSRKIGESLQKSHETHRSLSFLTPQLRGMIQTYGVAFHHSGMVPPLRIAIENLVKDGLLRFCTATMGLSLGINFSVRSALITDYARPGEGGITPYGTSEVLQMLGRAGRRGKDAVGFSLWPDVSAYAKMSGPVREDCNSRLKNDPTTFLGLVSRDYSLRDIEKFYEKSLLRFQKRHTDQTLITRFRVEKRLGDPNIPCFSPVAEFVRHFRKNVDSKCISCRYQVNCHEFIQQKFQSELATLHLHLHDIGALDREERLTGYGNLAKHFPHAGGLLIARMISQGEITSSTLMAACQLFAAISTARFKTPKVGSTYRFPYREKEIEDALEQLYPIGLFEEIYDQPFGRRNYPVIREFNPDMGYIVSEWLKGATWQELVANVATEKFGAGDITSVLYRTASYLQSINQSESGELGRAALALRAELLREPLDFGV
jgi:superfamily II RNA helicase